MKFNIYRTHLSGYWPKNFLELEKNSFSANPAVEYHGLELDSKRWNESAIILSNTHFHPDEIDILDWKKVKLILHANSGYDTLLKPAFLKSYNGVLLVAPKLRAQAVAEYNLQAWLLGLGTIPFAQKWDYGRNFDRRLAKNENVLIVGYGHVGRITAEMARAIQAKVEVYDPYIIESFPGKISSIDWKKYSTIIFCCSLTESSKQLIHWDKLNSKVILINASRGEVLDFHQAKKFALQNPEAKIFLDVYAKEPFEFETMPQNLFCSSHIAGVHQELLNETIQWHTNVVTDFCKLNQPQFLEKYSSENLKLKGLDL